ncbi:hypothetical protein G6F22_014911 [Rhizopus arrhizus]|nr:hypothetical protein G6F22_014911 [Rhizopus arrhizus]
MARARPSRPLVRLENEVVGALGELAVRIAGALVGRAYEAEPALLAQLVGEAIDAVGGSTREVEVRLHPDDIAALAPLLNLSPQQRLVPDTSLSRGDLRVHAEAVRIDGTLEARLRGALDAPADWAVARNLRLASRLDGLRVDTAHGRGLIREGVLRRAVGLTLEAVGCEAPLGASCKVEVVDGGWVDAEVVGFAGERTYLMPSAELHGLLPNARVVPSARRGGVAVGEGLLGRVIDSDGVPLDGKGPIRAEGHVGMAGVSINPLAREPITQPVSACSLAPASASRRCWA